MKWQGILVAGLLATIVLSLATDDASAQYRRGYRGRPGSTIQLPTFGANSVTTTVTAPDGGTVLLGGIKSARSGRTENGVPILGKLPFVGRGFRNVGIGREVNSSLMSVTPQIHVLEELERELMGGSPRLSSGASGRARGGGAGGHTSYRARESARQQFAQVQRPRRDTIANHASELRASEAGEQAEAELYFSKARTAYRQGKMSTARIYLRMAAGRATGDLRERVLFAQNAMDPSKTVLAGQ